jgi:hypothetical protein
MKTTDTTARTPAFHVHLRGHIDRLAARRNRLYAQRTAAEAAGDLHAAKGFDRRARCLDARIDVALGLASLLAGLHRLERRQHHTGRPR